MSWPCLERRHTTSKRQNENGQEPPLWDLAIPAVSVKNLDPDLPLDHAGMWIVMAFVN